MKEIDLPVPSSVTLVLEPLDGYDETVAKPDYVWNKEYLNINITGLERRRLWNYYIKPYSCQNPSIVEAEQLSKLMHDQVT